MKGTIFTDNNGKKYIVLDKNISKFKEVAIEVEIEETGIVYPYTPVYPNVYPNWAYYPTITGYGTVTGFENNSFTYTK